MTNQTRQKRSQPQKRSPFSKSSLLLMLLVLGLGFILGYRTRTYMNQIVVETTDAVLKEGPGTEFPQKSFLKKEQRLTVYSRKNHWLHVKTDNGKTGWVADWMIADGYKNPIEKLSDATIVIDAGHGGADSGALSIKNKMEKKRIILASGSPRRKELLLQIGIVPEIIVSHVEEKITSDEPSVVVTPFIITSD